MTETKEIGQTKRKKKGRCKMIRRLSHAFTKSKKDPEDPDIGIQDSGHLLKIHRHHHGMDSNIDMTEKEVRKTLKKEDVVRNHIEKEKALEEIRDKVSTLDGILHQLSERYVMTETICWCCKEGEMQEMIIEAINSYERKVVFNDTDSQDDMQLSPLNRLIRRTTGVSLNSQEFLFRDREGRYARMSMEEIVNELVTQEDSLTKLNIDFKQMEMRMQKMTKDYNAAQEHYFWKRYRLLQNIIEEATMDCIPLR